MKARPDGPSLKDSLTRWPKPYFPSLKEIEECETLTEEDKKLLSEVYVHGEKHG